jgi:hypothetical protein
MLKKAMVAIIVFLSYGGRVRAEPKYQHQRSPLGMCFEAVTSRKGRLSSIHSSSKRGRCRPSYRRSAGCGRDRESDKVVALKSGKITIR